LFDRIGRGGMADIYLARADTALGGSRLCVVKQILPELGRDPQFEKLLVEEAKLAARLTNANVVQVFDLGRESDRLFIAMEYVEGFDLNQLLRALSQARVPLPAEFALFIIREVLRALDHAHRLRDDAGQPFGLVHRDVSPSNVLISFEGEVKLCDFGIARALSAHEDHAADAHRLRGRVVGKSAYMAPEHARGEPIDARADVFSAGILLWELSAGRRLYKGSEDEMLAMAKQAKVSALPDRGLPEQAKLQSVLDRALSRFRDDRFQNAAEMLQALEEYAMSARLMASQLRFGAFLTSHFAKEIVELRRERERSVRSMSSEVPPAHAEPFQPEEPDIDVDEDAPTRVGELPYAAELSGLAATRHSADGGWNEPGAIDRPERPLDSARIVVQEMGFAQQRSAPVTPAQKVTDVELDQSLSGLDLLAQQTHAELRRSPVPASYASAASSRSGQGGLLTDGIDAFSTRSQAWVWYLVVAAIVASGAAAYFLM
jgi:serine/threonine-protein kinase